jgi:D-alanyl-D-alanine carboxypeptidase (penicillin-binding protein 5/6)
MGTPGGIYDEAAKLMDWGFATPADAAPVGQLVDPISASVVQPDDAPGAPGERAAGIAAAPTANESVGPAARATDLRLAAAGGAAAVVLFFAVLATRRRSRRR